MTWLLGVRHDDKHLGDVLRRLSKEDLAGKKVMVEMFSYPMTDDLRKMNSHFVNQWEGIAGYVLERKGQLVFGEDKELFYGALKSMDYIMNQMVIERKPGHMMWERIKRLEQDWRNCLIDFCERRYKENELYEQRKIEEDRISGKIKELEKQHKEAPVKERQPHLAKVVAQEKPDLIILNYYHMPYIIANCFPDSDYSLTCIPSKDLSYIYRNL